MNLSDKIDNIFPIKNNDIFQMYNKARSCFWIEKELDFSKDKFDWDNKLSNDERYFLSNILAFFAQSDQIVNINLEERFMEDVEYLPKDMKIYTKLFYNFQKMMEDIHSITYETLLETYITNKFDINDIEKISSVLENHLTTDVLRRGQEGVADMLKTYLLQTEKGEPIYECTDVARQKFEFRNIDGNIETDPNATKLIRNLGRSGMWVKAHTTGKKIWEKEDGTVNHEAQEVFLPNVMEVLEIDKDSKKLRKRLASITAKQKQNTKKV